MKKESYFYIEDLLKRHPDLSPMESNIASSIEELIQMVRNGGKLLICGNGGSFSDSQHIVGELTKVFKKKRSVNPEFAAKLNNPELAARLVEAVPALSLGSDEAYLTAYGNDEDYRYAFAQQVYALGKKEDVLLAISTSGNSLNCVAAAKVALAKGMKVIALTGMKASQLSEISTLTIQAPTCITHLVQEYHLPIYHTICLALEEELF